MIIIIKEATFVFVQLNARNARILDDYNIPVLCNFELYLYLFSSRATRFTALVYPITFDLRMIILYSVVHKAIFSLLRLNRQVVKYLIKRYSYEMRKIYGLFLEG